MHGDQDRQKVLGQGLVKAVKMTELGDVLKGPELLFLFSKKFGQLYKDGILNLEGLYHELRTTKDVDLAALQGFMLWFKDQEASLDVAMQLPADLLIMPADKRDKLKQRIGQQVEARLSSRRTPEPAAAAPTKAERIVLGGSTSRFRSVGLVAVGVLILLSALVNITQRMPPKADTQPVAQIDLAALRLPGRLLFKQEVFILRVPRAEWDQIPRELQRTRLSALQTALLGLGMSTLVVMDDTSWHTLAVCGKGDIVFVASTGAPG